MLNLVIFESLIDIAASCSASCHSCIQEELKLLYVLQLVYMTTSISNLNRGETQSNSGYSLLDCHPQGKLFV